jgi:hypothetical protein
VRSNPLAKVAASGPKKRSHGPVPWFACFKIHCPPRPRGRSVLFHLRHRHAERRAGRDHLEVPLRDLRVVLCCWLTAVREDANRTPFAGAVARSSASGQRDEAFGICGRLDEGETQLATKEVSPTKVWMRDNLRESRHLARMKIIFAISLIAAILAMTALSSASVSWAANDDASPAPIAVQGFDSYGEPEIRNGKNGALEIMFNFMPPLNGSDDANTHPIFETFENVLSKELGVEVQRDDRELFIIAKPAADTAARAKAFLETFWKDYFPKLESAPTPPG